MTLDMPFTGPVVYNDLMVPGNRSYAVGGNNAAGEGAPANRAAVFNFALRSGE